MISTVKSAQSVQCCDATFILDDIITSEMSALGQEGSWQCSGLWLVMSPPPLIPAGCALSRVGEHQKLILYEPIDFYVQNCSFKHMKYSKYFKSRVSCPSSPGSTALSPSIRNEPRRFSIFPFYSRARLTENPFPEVRNRKGTESGLPFYLQSHL